MRIFLAIAGIVILSPLAYYFPPYDFFVGKVTWSILIFLYLILLAKLAFVILDWGVLGIGVRWQRFFDYIRSEFHYLTYGYVMSPLLRNTFIAFIIFLHPITIMFINKLFRRVIIRLLIGASAVVVFGVLLKLVWHYSDEIRQLNSFSSRGITDLTVWEKLFWFPKWGFFDKFIALTDRVRPLFSEILWLTLVPTYILSIAYFMQIIINIKHTKPRRKTVRIDASIALEGFRNSVRKRLR